LCLFIFFSPIAYAYAYDYENFASIGAYDYRHRRKTLLFTEMLRV
jgi:hypothetical protein